MKRRLVCLLGALCATTAGVALGADPAGNYAIWGAGGRSCNQYLRSAQMPDEHATFKHYLMGYLTAYDALAPDTYSAVGTLTLPESLAWLDDYCDHNRLDSFERAITQFVASRHDERLRAPPGTGGWGRPDTAPATAGAQ